uniref:Transmembrane 7 superfamily member 3 n=1 Tax=Cynoglossus semilaevis TaxID=244447 RepID=A0A3P8WNT7_CYNSE
RVVFLPGTFQNVSVPQNETVQVVVSRISPNVTFVTLQFHTQRHNVTLSYVPGVGLFMTAQDSGLLSALQPGQTSVSLFLSSPDSKTVTGIGLILPFSTTPVPGGCNMEFNLDIDPNVYIHYNLYETTVHFAPANIGTGGQAPPLCDESAEFSTHWRLRYDIYQYFLPENDLSESSLFRSLQAVADARGMEARGRRFNSIPGQGVIYSVVVRDPLWNTSSSYVPSHTYACSFASTMDGCHTLKVSTKLFFTLIGLVGLFICFFGHRFFKCLFCMGFSFAAFFLFVLITRTTDLDYNRLALAAVVGVLGGVVLVMSWWRFGSVMACVVVVGLMLGFVVASIVLFTPLVYWVTFCCIMLTVPLVLVRWPREGNISTCGVVGGYAVILAVNAYMYTSLSFITLNVLKRLLNNNYSSVFTDVPFQTIFVLMTVWAALGVSGVVLQLYRERSRPFFPPSPYLMWLQERERRKTNVLDPSHHFPPLPNRLLARARQLTKRMEPAGEHTPLLL